MGQQAPVTEIFDLVMVCTGHHWRPKTPKFAGLSTFAGKQMHSHSYKDYRGFENLNVLVIGVGNSGAWGERGPGEGPWRGTGRELTGVFAFAMSQAWTLLWSCLGTPSRSGERIRWQQGVDRALTTVMRLTPSAYRRTCPRGPARGSRRGRATRACHPTTCPSAGTCVIQREGEQDNDKGGKRWAFKEQGALTEPRSPFACIPSPTQSDPAPGLRIPHSAFMDLVVDGVVEEQLQRKVDLRLYGLQPKHHFNQAHPSINDDLIGRINTGVRARGCGRAPAIGCGADTTPTPPASSVHVFQALSVRPNVREFRATSVVFEDGKEDAIDAVVFATGYDVRPQDARVRANVGNRRCKRTPRTDAANGRRKRTLRTDAANGRRELTPGIGPIASFKPDCVPLPGKDLRHPSSVQQGRFREGRAGETACRAGRRTGENARVRTETLAMSLAVYSLFCRLQSIPCHALPLAFHALPLVFHALRSMPRQLLTLTHPKYVPFTGTGGPLQVHVPAGQCAPNPVRHRPVPSPRRPHADLRGPVPPRDCRLHRKGALADSGWVGTESGPARTWTGHTESVEPLARLQQRLIPRLTLSPLASRNRCRAWPRCTPTFTRSARPSRRATSHRSGTPSRWTTRTTATSSPGWSDACRTWTTCAPSTLRFVPVLVCDANQHRTTKKGTGTGTGTGGRRVAHHSWPRWCGPRERCRRTTA